MIKVDENRCIGCFSCTNVCPNKNITLEEMPAKRTVHWAQCREECDLCVEFCPAKALTLVAESVESAITFELVPCKICSVPYATEPMLKKIESSLPVNLQKDSIGLSWIWICPVCRRKIEAERATKQIVLGRSRKNL